MWSTKFLHSTHVPSAADSSQIWEIFDKWKSHAGSHIPAKSVEKLSQVNCFSSAHLPCCCDTVIKLGCSAQTPDPRLEINFSFLFGLFAWVLYSNEWCWFYDPLKTRSVERPYCSLQVFVLKSILSFRCNSLIFNIVHIQCLISPFLPLCKATISAKLKWSVSNISCIAAIVVLIFF